MADTPQQKTEAPVIAIIGFSEMGKALAQGLLASGAKSVRAFDLRFEAGDDAEERRNEAAAIGVETAGSAREAAAGADIVVSAVTAGAAVKVAEDAARFIAAGQVFLDLNSISPEEKKAGAQVIEGAGGRYVEAAVLGPVAPHGHKVPMLFAGTAAQDTADRLIALGMNIDVAGDEVGAASAVKMCRSIVMKGMEALTVEFLCTARHYGVEDQVIDSLVRTYPGFDWRERSAYMLGRVFAHAARRAEEMRSAARTVEAAGFAPVMASAIAERQQWVADLRPQMPAEPNSADAAAFVDALIAAAAKAERDA